MLLMETDRTLLDAARKMDKEALIRIFDLYSPALFKYSLRLCGDPITADHIVGDVFVKLLEQFSAGKGPASNLHSYLYETAYHQLVDDVRAARHTISLEAAIPPRHTISASYPELGDQILLRRVAYVIQNELTKDQRHVIILRFLEGCSVRETAVMLGKSSNHVKVIQNRALAALRKALAYMVMSQDVIPLKMRKLSKALGVR
jgi:RNA polymerase sigma-70 factor (ECF subfamily)